MKEKKIRILEKRAYEHADKISAKRNYKCLHLGCENKAVRSHSQQRRGSLQVIARSGKVMRLEDSMHRTYSIEQGKFVFHFTLKGIGESSTFPGFCVEHENMFEIFETKPLVKDNHEQAAYLFYRTVSYEKARKRREHERWMEIIPRFAEFKGWDIADRYYRSANKLKDHIDITLDPVLHRTSNLLDRKEFSKIKSIWIEIPRNALASCSSCINLHLDEYVLYAAANPKKILPLFTFNLIAGPITSHAIISWSIEDDTYAEWLRDLGKDMQKAEFWINRFLLCDSEDACINPDLWNSFPESERIINSMSHVLMRGPLDLESIPRMIKII